MNSHDLKSAETYGRFSKSYLTQLRKRGMIELGFDEDDIVLDVGCGSGEASKEISAMVKSVTAFDASPVMVETAKTLNAADNIDYHVADAHSFDDHLDEWNHTSFDKIVSLFVFNWCHDPRRVLRNVKSCLKPGGRALLVFVLQTRILSLKCSYGETADSWIRCHKKWGPYMKVDYVHFQKDWENGEDFLEVVRSVGFDVCKSAIEEVCVPNQSAAEAKAGLRTLLGHLSAIPNDLRDECVDDVHRWLCDVTPKHETGYMMGQGSCITAIISNDQMS
nr:malonyl-[acyl-carrier protein] O-methyltransferase-like isoform X1 [Lytechinus pictus]